MKVPIFLFYLALCATVSAKTYYVAPTGGSNLYPGTITQPWATWQKAFNTAIAGDTVYFRGGTWYPDSHATGGYAITDIDPGAGRGHNGTRDNPICFFNYPDETPILDCTNASIARTGNIGLNTNKATHLKFRGLTIKNVRMLNVLDNCTGIEMKNCGVMSFENCTTYNIGGAGFWFAGYDTLYLTNCDTYNCCDSLDATAPGGDGDGYNITGGGEQVDTFKVAYITGCRAWNCSDDGFDLGGTKQFQMSNCWSFHNGWQYIKGAYHGDGNGFKLASSDVLTTSKRRFYNLIAACNLHFGIETANLVDVYYGPRGAYYNISLYKNELGILEGAGAFNCLTGKSQDIYRNIVDYVTAVAYHSLLLTCVNGDSRVIDHNNWNVVAPWPYWETAIPVTDADFVSLDTLQLYGARKADGSLPDITFLKLKGGSDLIDAGIDVGLAYNGPAPDIGAFEYDRVPGTGNKYPYVVITSPSNRSTLTNKNIIINAEASDADGSISKVEFFYDDAIKIGETNSYPWTCPWNNAPLGNQSIRAVATDNLGAKATSSMVNVTILPDINDIKEMGILYPNPNDGNFTLFLASPLKRNSNVTIISLEGRTIFNGTMSAEERIKQFDLPFLKPGIYVFILSSFEVIYAQEFIKE